MEVCIISDKQKPDCPLIGQDGNIFNLMGIASQTLKEHDMPEQAKEMEERIRASGSYHEAIGIIGDYVNITTEKAMRRRENAVFRLNLKLCVAGELADGSIDIGNHTVIKEHSVLLPTDDEDLDEIAQLIEEHTENGVRFFIRREVISLNEIDVSDVTIVDLDAFNHCAEMLSEMTEEQLDVVRGHSSDLEFEYDLEEFCAEILAGMRFS